MPDTLKTLKKAAQSRLLDAETLLQCKRYIGACYLAGYVVELYLKAVVLKEYEIREGLPQDSVSVAEFSEIMKRKGLDTLKTHAPGELFTIYSSYSRLRTCTSWFQDGVAQRCGVLGWSEKWRYENGWVPPNVSEDFAGTFVKNVKYFRDLIRSEVG